MTDSAQTEEIGDERPVSLSFGVLFSTAGAVADVEDWLDDNCAGDWSLSVEGMDDALIKKSLRIMFEQEADKIRFIDVFARS